MDTRNSELRILLLFVLFFTGCLSTTPEPVTVEVTRVVEVTSEPATSGTEATIPLTEVRTLHSSAIGRDYRIDVALPLSYSSNTEQTYPVIYLLDGNMLFGLVTFITRLMGLFEELPELIIVGIGYGSGWIDDPGEYSRLRWIDYTPTNIKARPGSGGAGEFLKFIQEDLIPYVDAKYRTDPMDRTLVGNSAGGLFSLYALFHAPETFNRYIAGSPILNWDYEVTFEYEEEFARKHSDLPVNLFLSVGEFEEKQLPGKRMVYNLEEFHRRLEDRNYAGLEMEMVVMEDQDHVTVFQSVLSKGLKTIFR